MLEIESGFEKAERSFEKSKAVILDGEVINFEAMILLGSFTYDDILLIVVQLR